MPYNFFICIICFIIYVIYVYMVGELLTGFQDVAFLPSRGSFQPYFVEIVVEVTALGLPHVLKLWLGVSKGLLPVEYHRSNKVTFCVS